MKARPETRTLLAMGVVVALLACPVWSAAETTGGAENLTVAPATAYKALLTGDAVRIRSGPGTHFYDCGTLSRGDTVEVWGEEKGWSKITPPPGSFSWVATKHIVVDATEPTEGIVVGPEATVYAGSDFEKPMHSTTVQVVLKRKDKTHLLNEEKDGYLKISPPAGSHLWVSSQYLKRLATPRPATPERVVSPTVMPTVPVETTPSQPDASSTVETGAPLVTDTSTPEGLLLAEFYAIQARIEEELAKPRAEQDYQEIEASLKKLAENEESERVASFAEIILARVEGFKLAIKVGEEVAVQDELLKEATMRISKAKSQRLAEVPKLGRFAVIGTLKKSNVNLRRFRVVAASGKTVCYAQPVGTVADAELSTYLGKRVGLVGSIKAHAPSKSALVEFTHIEAVP